jgi:ATP:ADP antiporter, AAA family
MIPRVRRFLDVRPGEGLPVLLTFLYVAIVVACYLLAKPIRQSLFLAQYEPFDLVYVYAAVPLALTLFVPAYTRVVARFGSRNVAVGTLVFFATNVMLFWYAFRFARFALLPGVFFVWVGCFGVIAPVQAWSFANSLFDTRQAKRLFGLIGSGASFGGIAAGLAARELVTRVGGTVNMMLVLAGMILAAAMVVVTANLKISRRAGTTRTGRPPRQRFGDALAQIRGSRYLTLMATLVFLVAVATQWTGFQLNFVVKQRFLGDEDAMTRFFGTFNFALGAVSFLIQLLMTAPLLRRFGVSVVILLLPLTLGTGSLFICLAPAFWPVLFTAAGDQSLRFSLDKATYELLYLPIPYAQRTAVKNAIDIVVSRFADLFAGILLGVATKGFFFLPGIGLGLRGTAAINTGIIGIWVAVAWQLRREYVRTIHESIYRHRIDTERTTTSVLERSAAEALAAKLASDDPRSVRFALSVLEAQATPDPLPQLHHLLDHPDSEIRRRAIALLAAAGDRNAAPRATELLRDPDISVRTEALLYLTRGARVDPLLHVQELGAVEEFSIRSAMAAFLAGPGDAQNLDAARAVLEGMTRSPGTAGVRDRTEAARLAAIVPGAFVDLLGTLIADENVAVARQAIRSARTVGSHQLVPALIQSLGRGELVDDAAAALAAYGDSILSDLDAHLRDPETPAEVRRELPSVLVRIGSAGAEQILIAGLLEADVTLRHRVVASLNKLRDRHPDIRIDPDAVELLLAAEIAGHYRSYQVLGPLRKQLKDDDPVLEALRHSMEQEIERIFRVMALLFPQAGLHDAYVGLRSGNAQIRANALEFLDNTLKPELRQVLVPLLDSMVTVDERIEIANRTIGAPLDSTEQSIATLLASEDGWLRSCAVYAVGALQLHGLARELRRFEASDDPIVRQSVATARRRLAGEAAEMPQAPAPPDMDLGVGAG